MAIVLDRECVDWVCDLHNHLQFGSYLTSIIWNRGFFFQIVMTVLGAMHTYSFSGYPIDVFREHCALALLLTDAS